MLDEDRNTTGIYGDHKEAPYDMDRESRLQLLTRTARTDNTRNTVKEELILETVENFRAQYVALYPTRAPLLLSPQNEFGCRKFISTFIRPSQLKFDELYNWDTLSNFIANYIRYEELLDLSTLPSTIASPATTMQWQIGNCVEIAILLASLLNGNGYNAYVCLGYATKAVCANDQSNTPWPDHLPDEVNPDDIVIPKPKPNSEYVQHLKERPKLISTFDEQERKYGTHRILTDETGGADKNNNNNKNADGDSGVPTKTRKERGGEGDDDDDDGDSKLVHAWVMIRPDRRQIAEPNTNIMTRLNLQSNMPFLGIPSTSVIHEKDLPAVGRKEGDKIIIETRNTKSSSSSKEKVFIDEPIFIEPATGLFVRASDPKAATFYEGIEAIFNKENYFVNMNPKTSVDKLPLDLKDLVNWERIFLADPSMNSGSEEEVSGDTLRAKTAGGGVGGAGGGVGAAGVVGGGGAAGGGVAGLLGGTTASGAMLSPNGTVKLGATASGGGGGLNSTLGLNATVGGGTIEPTSTVGEGGDQTLDLVLSWVPPITLNLQQYNNRYPDRQKLVVYKGVTVEMYAEYSEPDLKVLVVTVEGTASNGGGEAFDGAASFSSGDQNKGPEIHTFYKHRSDRMRRKAVYPQHPIPSQHQHQQPQQMMQPSAYGPGSGGGAFGGGGFGSSGGGGGGGVGAAGSGGTIVKTHYWFEPGRMQEGTHRAEGLRELILEPGYRRTMRFYWKSRDDGLATRIERFSEGSRNTSFPSKVKEFYKGRTEDFLLYRSAKYGTPREGGAGGGGGGGLGVAALPTKDHRLEPIKMSEKFARNPKTHIDSDIEKRVYVKPQSSSEGEIWVKYHFRPGCITRGVRLYPKTFDRDKDLTTAAMITKGGGGGGSNADGFMGGGAGGGGGGGAAAGGDVQPYVVLMPDMEHPKDTDLLNELRVLVDKETECLNEIRAKTDDCKDILAQLSLETEGGVSSSSLTKTGADGGRGAGMEKRNQIDNALISIFDTQRGRAKETEAEIAQRKAEELRRAESRKDYLAPFIAKQENMAKNFKGDYTNVKLPLEMARKVRDEAIADLKERLIERGHIMQARLDKEREDLMRRQMAFQKAIDGTDGAKESEEFSRFGKEATWRIRILEERLSNYIKSSADKYRQLADKLANDKRLAALYATGDQR